MRYRIVLLAVAAAFGGLACAPLAAGAEPLQPAARQPNVVDLSAQQQRRARTRVTVYPRRTALGPNAVRECRSWLAQEHRPSGTVIVPRMQCWWE